jgi:hypothetical protein
MSGHTVRTYLTDHLAGSVAALEVFDYLIHAHSGTPMALALSELRKDVEQDQRVLEQLLRDLGGKPSRTRQAMAWVIEKLGRAKLRIDDRSGGEFSDLEALETLCLGIQGKAGLWRALAVTEAPVFRSLDCAALERRALDQFKRTDALRLAKAPAALSL